VLFAIAKPASLAGLLVAFLLGLSLRVIAMRLAVRVLRLEPPGGRLLPSPREDIDPFGAVVALIAGTGWGRPVDIDAMPRFASRGKRAFVVLVGPLAALVAGLAGLTAYRLLFPDERFVLTFFDASAVLRGALGVSYGAQFVLALAVGLLCFGLLALIPLPPLDGFALLWLSLRQPSAAAQKARYWLTEKNLGVVILMVMTFFPLASPFLHIFIDLLAAPFLWAWA
jgi:Zn-dependent protease